MSAAEREKWQAVVNNRSKTPTALPQMPTSSCTSSAGSSWNVRPLNLSYSATNFLIQPNPDTKVRVNGGGLGTGPGSRKRDWAESMEYYGPSRSQCEAPPTIPTKRNASEGRQVSISEENIEDAAKVHLLLYSPLVILTN